ncbi:hypothetical protein SKAU_G00136640 [Synaphobranchus kaupii]|uniref:Uncharacterized protein n=1 Tax=Synaphobranchus kaupii TaxID=118154 RepID=A0A9Q1J3V3_SYNKA|nr:hypothetical protein SKAU_G00136640 [Synaphobranchus kaupii]
MPRGSMCRHPLHQLSAQLSTPAGPDLFISSKAAVINEALNTSSFPKTWGVLQLNKQLPLFLPAQPGSRATGLKTARLMIWTPDENVVLYVQFDEMFVREQVKRLRAFYFSCMLPRLVDEFVGERLKLDERYAEIVRKV